MSDYDFRPGGSLKLKSGTHDGGVTKKKKKRKHDNIKEEVEKKRKLNEAHSKAAEDDDKQGESSTSNARKSPPEPSSSRITEAERKFREAKSKRMNAKVASQAKKSHKELVADFNEKLEALSEHHDIPKVGPG
ncbi:DUF1754-domain-containing protein [Schizopora paradoxa]|uniref:DUF1754-domain-containing protein n=1 Tax=Schizopora paradoxa TaxID=27342 RepID=A0A0H2S9V1_9AGAM|nr:DUF1754-domain-containing protein [Schizopora paradoxa]